MIEQSRQQLDSYRQYEADLAREQGLQTDPNSPEIW